MRHSGKDATAALDTARHRRRARKATPTTCPNCDGEIRRRFCEVCGYELIEETRAKVTPLPRV